MYLTTPHKGYPLAGHVHPCVNGAPDRPPMPEEPVMEFDTNGELTREYIAALAEWSTAIEQWGEQGWDYGENAARNADFASYENCKLRKERDDEKQRRIYYQDICYSIARFLDTEHEFICVGHKGEPSTELQDAARRVLEERNTLAKRVEVLEKALREIADMRTWAGLWRTGETRTLSHERMNKCYDIAEQALTLADAGEDVAQGKGGDK